jgi:hypothetical protein
MNLAYNYREGKPNKIKHSYRLIERTTRTCGPSTPPRLPIVAKHARYIAISASTVRGSVMVAASNGMVAVAAACAHASPM